jgi:hypothetical protein
MYANDCKQAGGCQILSGQMPTFAIDLVDFAYAAAMLLQGGASG